MSHYPEKIPETKPLDKFTFSLSAANTVKDQLQNEYDTIQSRLDRIVNEVLLDGMPVLKLILQASHDRKELKKLAKAIDRLADLVEHQDSISVKLNVIKTAQKDPSWFALAFGDFSDDVDSSLNSIFNPGE